MGNEKAPCEEMVSVFLFTKDEEKYRLLGFCAFLDFFSFQVMRAIFVLILFILVAFTIFIDLRAVVFILGDWTIMLTFISFLLVFFSSGKQKTELVLADRGKPLEEAEKAGLMWKYALILYEMAAALTLLQFGSFWGKYRETTIDHYRSMDETKSGPAFRVPVIYIINVLPFLIFIVDMVFNKLLFRFKHLVIVIVLVVLYAGIVALRPLLLPHEDFPGVKLDQKDDYLNLIYGGLVMAGCHILITAVTLIRYKILKNKEWGNVSVLRGEGNKKKLLREESKL